MSADHKEVIDEIAAFEKNLKNFVSAPSSNVGIDAASSTGKTTKDYIKKIRSRKQIEISARLEREKRRRKVFVEQQEAQKEMERKRREELILEKLLKQSQEERRITAHLLEVRAQKERMKQNRIERSALLPRFSFFLLMFIL